MDENKVQPIEYIIARVFTHWFKEALELTVEQPETKETFLVAATAMMTTAFMDGLMSAHDYPVIAEHIRQYLLATSVMTCDSDHCGHAPLEHTSVIGAMIAAIWPVIGGEVMAVMTGTMRGQAPLQDSGAD